jgi:hypothetical protein
LGSRVGLPSPRRARLPKVQWKIGREGFVMKIIWRNPNRVSPKRISIINTGKVATEDLMYFFYRYSSDMGVLVTDFELLVKRNVTPHAA